MHEYGELPFGLREVQLTPYASDGTLDTANRVQLPAARVFEFSDSVDIEKLEGDDTVIAIAEKDVKIEWSLEAGGVSFDVYSLLSGVPVVEVGVTPDRVKTITRTVDTRRKYFLVEGRAISDSGGDYEMRVFKAKAGPIEGGLKGGEFVITKCDGEAIANALGQLWQMKAKESAKALTQVAPSATIVASAPLATGFTAQGVVSGLAAADTLKTIKIAYALTGTDADVAAAVAAGRVFSLTAAADIGTAAGGYQHSGGYAKSGLTLAVGAYTPYVMIEETMAEGGTQWGEWTAGTAFTVAA